MTCSFDGTSTLGERGRGPGGPYPVWAITGNVVIKKIPGGDKTVVQIIGQKLPRLALIVKVTAAQLAALRTKAEAGTTGTLVFSFETATATLINVTDIQEQGAGHDVYFATLHLIRSSPYFAIASASTTRITESGDVRLTEDGQIRIVE
jgi:hypothetical protein